MKLSDKIKNYYKEHGARGVFLRIMEKTTGYRPGEIPYEKWLKCQEPCDRELEEQRKKRFSYMPRFSILVPVYYTKEEYLRELILSVEKQTYPNWELCLSDGSGKASPVAKILKEYETQSSKIKVSFSKQKLGISENTNAAMGLAEGEFLLFVDHDDLLEENTLFECVSFLNKNPEIDVFYTDEDKISMDGKKHFDPQFKPDFDFDLLRSMNYICHLFAVRRTIAQKVGLLHSAYDGAQDYDYIFRCVEQTDHIGHISKILYHWRCHAESTAENQESKSYAFEAGKRAIEAHLLRGGCHAQVTSGQYLGLYQVHYPVTQEPLISILIPNKDHLPDLKRCLESLHTNSAYRHYEIIIIENNSKEKETFQYYNELQNENTNIKVVEYQGHFNYSAINNFGAGYAKGDYLLFLNNDTELISEHGLEEMLGICERTEVGAVGARLYYQDNTIQHAGVIIGLGGIAGHAFSGERRSATGYCRRIICTHQVSAVTAACMMIKKETFEQLQGFDEQFEVTFNDIDLCLRIREIGKLIVYTPYAEFYHYESKSRGKEDSPEKVERFHGEIGRFANKWETVLEQGDPYYNQNLSLMSKSYTLKNPAEKRQTYGDLKERMRKEYDSF